MIIYRCSVCGYLHTGNIDFHFCPTCNSPSSVFIRDSGADNFGTWDVNIRRMIRYMAETGSYYMEGKGTSRSFLNMDNLIFLPAQIYRLPLDDKVEINTEIILGKTAQHDRNKNFTGSQTSHGR